MNKAYGMCLKKQELAHEKENDQKCSKRISRAYKNRQIFHMAQQVIPAAQLVPRYHTNGRCNNYVMLQSIPCSPKCKIVGQILLDHPLSYALTTTVDVPVVCLQQFWQTAHKVPNTKDTMMVKLQ
ncbi:hypothetical protein Tco_1002952 [Tanacetum coccineum]|uniref:Uncharacterized protein n=1 Tax=Tanacetum coccineum TaxID=301880 RepID=A0ABQ5F8U3_9ASTR